MLVSTADTRARERVTGLLLATHPGPAVAVTVMAGALAVAAGLSVTTTGLVVAAVLTGQLSIGWSNDLLDRNRDVRAGREDKPLVTGKTTPNAVVLACAAALVATTALSLALGARAGIAQLVVVIGGWAYNLRLKSTAWSWLPYAVAFGALPLVPWLAAAEPLRWWLPAAGGLLGVGAHLLNALPDLEDDRATGVVGLPHRLAERRGPHAVAIVAVGLFVAATVVVSTALPFGPATVVAGIAVAALAVVALVTRGRQPFRAAIGMALVCVALLVVAV